MNSLRHFRIQAVVAVAAAVAMLALVVPLPGWTLDVLLSANLAVSLAVFALAVLVSRPVRLTSLPGLMVVSSLGRVVLALAVARNILLGGAGGQLVAALGGMGGGGWPADVAIVLMVALIDLLVIGVGMVRVSEVLARFALDALPGRQMAIDAAVADGRLSATEAIEKQRQVDAECAFFGAMDGAARFLRGDCVATLAIVAATPVVALLTGQTNAAGTSDLAGYLHLATGHGLVILLPALLVGGAGAMILTRAGSEETFGSEIAGELVVQPLALGATATVLFVVALVSPGARVLLLLMTVVVTTAAVAFRKRNSRSEEPRSPSSERGANRIETGLGLVHLVGDGGFGMMLSEVRQKLQRRLGVPVAPFAVSDNAELGMDQVALVISGQLASQYTVRPGRLLAVGVPHDDFVGADDARCGARSLGAWILPEDEHLARNDGAEVLAPLPALLALVEDRVMACADDLFGVQDAAELLAQLSITHPHLVALAGQEGLDAVQLRRIGAALLRDGVGLHSPAAFLEGAVDAWRDNRDEQQVVEAVRKRLARSICQAAGPDGTILAIELAPPLEDELVAACEGGSLALPPELAERWLRLLAGYSLQAFRRRHPIAILCNPAMRPVVSELVAESGQNLMAVAFDELEPDYAVERLATITDADLCGPGETFRPAEE